MPDVDRASQPNLKRISRGPRFKTIVLPEDDNFLDSSPSVQNDGRKRNDNAMLCFSFL